MKTKIQTSKAAFIIDNAGFDGEIDFNINAEGIAEMKRQIEAQGLCTDKAAMEHYSRETGEHMVIKSQNNRFEQSYYSGNRLVIWFIELNSDKHFDCYFYASEEEIDALYKAAVDKFYEKKAEKEQMEKERRKRKNKHHDSHHQSIENKM